VHPLVRKELGRENQGSQKKKKNLRENDGGVALAETVKGKKTGYEPKEDRKEGEKEGGVQKGRGGG